jgi:hypothetical protein
MHTSIYNARPDVECILHYTPTSWSLWRRWTRNKRDCQLRRSLSPRHANLRLPLLIRNHIWATKSLRRSAIERCAPGGTAAPWSRVILTCCYDAALIS